MSGLRFKAREERFRVEGPGERGQGLKGGKGQADSATRCETTLTQGIITQNHCLQA